MKSVLLALITLTAAVGCDAWLTKPSLYNTVQVIATRRNGDPIPGVRLVLYTGQRPMGYATTGSDGRFTFTRVPQGDYGVSAQVPAGYDVIENLTAGPSSVYHDALIVANDTLSPVRFIFLKVGPGAVVVHVAQSDGTPLSGVTVQLYDSRKIDGVATTDVAGRAVFNLVPFGLYGVTVIRPFLYRDYLRPADSLTSSRDNLLVEQGSRDSVDFSFARCAGAVRATVQDSTGAPVPNTAVELYTSTDVLGDGKTGPDGQFVFAPVACAIQLGVRINPPAGYSVTQGRGSSFIDGLTPANGATINAVFRVQRLP